MAAYQVVYWRAIPSQVKVGAGRSRVARLLPQRFQDAIDRAAMRSGLFNTDDYLSEWRTVDMPARDGEAEAVADAVASELDASYPDARLDALALNGGEEAGQPA
jgi:hypothetical protein